MSNTGNVFDPSTMEETVKVGDKELTIAPLKLKPFRRFVAAIDGALKSLREVDPKSTNSEVVEQILQFSGPVFESIFPKDLYPFMSPEFIEENMSVPLIRHILERAVVVNRVDDLFPFFKTTKPAG